jgi:hypothetical protein
LQVGRFATIRDDEGELIAIVAEADACERWVAGAYYVLRWLAAPQAELNPRVAGQDEVAHDHVRGQGGTGDCGVALKDDLAGIVRVVDVVPVANEAGVVVDVDVLAGVEVRGHRPIAAARQFAILNGRHGGLTGLGGDDALGGYRDAIAPPPTGLVRC